MPMSLRRLLAPAAALAVAACPADAVAAALAPLKPCYVSVDRDEREPVPVEASGFTPRSRVDVAVDGAIEYAGVQVDDAGAVSGRVRAPHQVRGERPFTITVTEQGNPANAVSATAMVTALRVRLRPRRARSHRRVRFEGRGFTGPGPIYGHYVFRGRERKTVRLAPGADGPCGTFTARRRQIPVRRPAAGEWTLQIDQQRRYSPAPEGVSVPVRIEVRRVLVQP
jgi:hypothetical protein